MRTTQELENLIKEYTDLLDENKALAREIRSTSFAKPNLPVSFLCTSLFKRHLILSHMARVSLISASFNSSHYSKLIDLTNHSIPMTLIMTEVLLLDSFDFALPTIETKRLEFSAIVTNDEIDDFFIARLFERNMHKADIIMMNKALFCMDADQVQMELVDSGIKISSSSFDAVKKLKKELEARLDR